MKKRIAALLLALLLLASTAGAYTVAELNTADALNHLSLFLGTGKGYELDNSLTRAQGITLLVRLIGAEEAAGQAVYAAPFTDVPDWAKPQVNYAYVNGITNGVSATSFAPNSPMTDAMFLTLVLRAMGYSDSGAKPQFTWDSPYKKAKEVGLTVTDTKDAVFTRGDAVTVLWNALNSLLADGSTTMAQKLMAQGLFTENQYKEAIWIHAVGLSEPEPEPEPEPELPSEPEQPGGTTYSQYIAMSFEEKQAFRATFATTADFFAWYNQALADHEAQRPTIEIGSDGVIDLGGN